MKTALTLKSNTKARRSAQSSLEYAAIALFLGAALVAMNIYIKRGIQGRLREAADSIGEQYSANTTTGFMTQNVTENFTIFVDPLLVNITNATNVTIGTGEVTIFNRTGTTLETQQYNSSEKTGNFSDEKLYE